MFTSSFDRFLSVYILLGDNVCWRLLGRLLYTFYASNIQFRFDTPFLGSILSLILGPNADTKIIPIAHVPSGSRLWTADEPAPALIVEVSSSVYDE